MQYRTMLVQFIPFCKINDIMVNTTKVNKFMPPQVKSKKTFAYNHQMIGQLLDIADERMRIVILLPADHGLRIGAIPGLNVGSCEEYKDLYKITIYENQPEEYVVFTTSELKRRFCHIWICAALWGSHHKCITLGSGAIRQTRPVCNSTP